MEQDDRQINVKFPSKMEVHSPEIESIQVTSNRISNWLHNDLKNIIEPLTVVKFIPDLIKELKQIIVNQFTNLQLGQVESDVINRQANIKVLNKKIESTQTHIIQKEEYLNKTIDRVTERYSSLSIQLSKEHEDFLRKLDSHAYNILEKIYPLQVQDKFSFDSLPVISFLSEHALVSVAERSLCLEQGLNNALKGVNTFINEREQFLNELSEYSCNSLEEGYYQLPWCFVEMINNKTGEIRFECWFECELEKGEKDPVLDSFRNDMEFMAESFIMKTDGVNEIIDELNDFLNNEIPDVEKKRFILDLQQNINLNL